MNAVAPPPVHDTALPALEQLIACIDDSVDELARACARAERPLAERRQGHPWLELVREEPRPLVVETVSSVPASLAAAGHTWRRREEAAALRREHVSIYRIATLFGVTRQRISALLRERDGASPSAG
ncbi:hypothetical protein [Blastococcus sp. SYSU DS0973]